MLDDETLEGKFIDGLHEDIKVEMRRDACCSNLQKDMTHKIEDIILHHEDKKRP